MRAQKDESSPKQTETFLKGFQASINKRSLPKFWDNYPEKNTHTFQDVLDKYAEYYSQLFAIEEKEDISKIF